MGVLNGYNAVPCNYAPQELEFLAAMGAQAALAVEIARRQQEQQRTIQALEATHRALAAKHDLLQRTEAVHRELSGVVLAGGGAEDIAATLARLTANPVLYWDRHRCLVCAAGDAEPWRHLLELPEVAGKLSGLARRRELLLLEPRPGEGLTAPVALAPVLVGADLYGYLCMVAAQRLPADLDLAALQRGALVMALEMAKRRIVAQTEERLKGSFLEDLLQGRFASEEAMLERARMHGKDLTRPHRVLDDLGLFRTLLFNVRNPRVLAAETAVLLTPLLDQDREKGSGLLATVEAYLNCQCDQAAAGASSTSAWRGRAAPQR